MKKLIIFLLFLNFIIFAEDEIILDGFIAPTQSGRVLIIPTTSLELTGFNTPYNLFLLSSDFEYQTSFLSDNLAIFGNLGLGFWGDNLMFNFEGGIKYKFDYLITNLRPFIESSIAFSPIIVIDRITTDFSFIVGAGVQYYVTDQFGLEGSFDMKYNRLINFLPETEVYQDINTLHNSLNLKINFSFIFIF